MGGTPGAVAENTEAETSLDSTVGAEQEAEEEAGEGEKFPLLEPSEEETVPRVNPLRKLQQPWEHLARKTRIAPLRVVFPPASQRLLSRPLGTMIQQKFLVDIALI